jgi:hypothetical protein
VEQIAVINEAHNVALRIQAWMLKSLGYKVYVAGGSFHGVVENYHNSNQKLPELSGTMELRNMPQDALFLDTHPKTIERLRAKGWNGPILMVWYMPVGPDWVKENFKILGKCGSLAWSEAVARGVREMNACPSDFFWPPYYGPLDQTQRTSIGSYLITAVENAQGWSNVGVLQELRDHPESKLELDGGGPPDWSRKLPQKEFFARLRASLAMYHLKPFDTPGFAVMEAALQGVPIIFPHDWIRCTETSFFKHGENCLVVETKRDAVLELVRKLKDPEYNRKIGAAGREVVARACHWGVNSIKFKNLIEAVRSMR